MTESPIGSKPSARDIREVRQGTATAHDRREVAVYRGKGSKKHKKPMVHTRRKRRK